METGLRLRVDASKAKKEAPQKATIVMIRIHSGFLVKKAITPPKCIRQGVVFPYSNFV
jgi:hypothetical protein